MKFLLVTAFNGRARYKKYPTSELTRASRCAIRLHSSTNRCVPSMLIVTDNFNFSSNLTVAALWNTTLTVFDNVKLSLALIASSGSVMSPSIGSTLPKSAGRSFRTMSKS